MSENKSTMIVTLTAFRAVLNYIHKSRCAKKLNKPTWKYSIYEQVQGEAMRALHFISSKNVILYISIAHQNKDLSYAILT